MVTKVKTLDKEQHWVKSACEQIGLGAWKPKGSSGKVNALGKFSRCMLSIFQVGSRVFLPNLPSVCALLYRIKHVVEITPVTFPKGMPDDFHPDTHGFRLTPTGEFIVEGPPAESLSSVAARADWMKLTEKDIKKEARRHWDSPWGTPLGNQNYHRCSIIA